MTFQEEVKCEANKMLVESGISATIDNISRAGAVQACGIASDLAKIAMYVVNEAATARLNAGYSGAHDDGGAGHRLDQLKGYLEGVVTGLSGTITATSLYARTLAVVLREQDPEYQKYLELKAKFGDK